MKESLWAWKWMQQNGAGKGLDKVMRTGLKARWTQDWIWHVHTESNIKRKMQVHEFKDSYTFQINNTERSKAWVWEMKNLKKKSEKTS